MGRYFGADGQWHEAGLPPAEGWWIDASDIWQPPMHAPTNGGAAPASPNGGVSANPPPPRAPAPPGVVGAAGGRISSPSVGKWLALAACGSVFVMAIAAVALFGNLWDRAGEQIDGSTCDAFWLLSAEINSGDDPSAALEQFRLGIRGHNDTEVGRAAEQLARGDTDDPQTLEAVETLADACS